MWRRCLNLNFSSKPCHSLWKIRGIDPNKPGKFGEFVSMIRFSDETLQENLPTLDYFNHCFSLAPVLGKRYFLMVNKHQEFAKRCRQRIIQRPSVCFSSQRSQVNFSISVTPKSFFSFRLHEVFLKLLRHISGLS